MRVYLDGSTSIEELLEVYGEWYRFWEGEVFERRKLGSSMRGKCQDSAYRRLISISREVKILRTTPSSSINTT